MMFGDEPIPKPVVVEGVYTSALFFKTLVEKGIQIFEDVRLNPDTDLVLATYPRTGTTWLSQIVSLLYAGEDGYEEVSSTPIDARVVYMDIDIPGEKPVRERLQHMAPPRFVKSHLPYKFLVGWMERDRVKSVVTLRNPKDTLVSMYHFHKMLFGYQGTWNEFFTHVQAGRLMGGDPVEWMDKWLKESKRNKNILILKYEDMIEDLPQQMNKIIKFLDLNVTKETFERVLQDATFDSMRSNPMTNQEDRFKETKFIRSGKVGQWKNVFTVAQNEWFDEKYGKMLEESGLDLTSELPRIVYDTKL